MSFDNVEPVVRSTASTRIADTLRAAILDGSMVPGAQLKETALADRLSVSRGPLREAVQRLVQEGLLWTQPHHGTFVVELGRDDVADVYLARRAIESTAAMRLMEMSDKTEALKSLEAAVSNLRTAVKDGGWFAVVGADIAFHERLVDSVKSKRLTRMFGTLAAETRLCMNLLVASPDWVKGVVADHRELVDAFRGDDSDLVLKRLDAHLSLEEFVAYRGDLQAHVNHGPLPRTRKRSSGSHE
jgi:DNA-binding GntR family transcriptional regulator